MSHTDGRIADAIGKSPSRLFISALSHQFLSTLSADETMANLNES